MKKVLAVAAHPDDEVLGCGGTLARHVQRGDEVHILVLADGVGARGSDQSDLEQRRQAAVAASRVLGAQSLLLESLPDNRMDSRDLLDVIQLVEKVVDEVRPQIVYTHHHGDLNVDHRITHNATVTACRPTAGRCVELLAAFEVLSSSEWATPTSGTAFLPNFFVDVTATFDLKLEALGCYADEMRTFPHPRSTKAVTALAELRGSTIGAVKAEAFEIVRQIDADVASDE